jgi:hypothetical protein
VSAKDIYVEAIEKRLNLGTYFAMWPVGQDIEVGMIGRREDKSFVPKGDLRRFETVELAPPDERPDGLNYASGRGVDVNVSTNAETGGPVSNVTDVELKAEVKFHSKDQIALRATGVRFLRVVDEREFADRIINAFYNKEVREGDQFVAAIVTAESGAAGVSADAGASMTLTGKGKLTAGTKTLGALEAGIKIGNTSKTALDVPMPNGFVVAYRILELDKKGLFWQEPVVEAVRKGITDAVDGKEPEYVALKDPARTEESPGR